MSSTCLPFLLAAGCAYSARGHLPAVCPGTMQMDGHDPVSIVPTGWKSSGGGSPVSVLGKQIEAKMGSRAYFADTCTAGTYDASEYVAMSLLGKTISYTTDLSKAECGCNAAFYLTSMRQHGKPSECGDFYCDANNVCGESCTEIDLQEGNKFAWHSTLHTASDKSGLGGGYGGGGSGWNGPRDWESYEYGPGAKCIDTMKPFKVAVSFPVDTRGALAAMEVKLTQPGRDCPLITRLSNYSGNHSIKHGSHSAHSAMGELSAALSAGMTPIVSYWKSDAMLWLDGRGKDYEGPCAVDEPKTCGDSVTFSDFKVEDVKAEPEPAWREDSGSSGAVAAAQSQKAVLILEAPQVPPHFLDNVEKATLGTAKGEIPVQVISVAWDGSNVKKPPATPTTTAAPSPVAGLPTAATVAPMLAPSPGAYVFMKTMAAPSPVVGLPTAAPVAPLLAQSPGAPVFMKKDAIRRGPLGIMEGALAGRTSVVVAAFAATALSVLAALAAVSLRARAYALRSNAAAAAGVSGGSPSFSAHPGEAGMARPQLGLQRSSPSSQMLMAEAGGIA